MNRREFLDRSARGLTVAPLAMAQRPLPTSEFDYVDWSWRRWREITRETRPTVTSDQTGRADLSSLVGADRSPSGAEWQKQRDGVRSLFRAFLGSPPAGRPDLAPRIEDESETDLCIRRRVSYEVEPGERIHAYVLIPKKLRGRAPAVLCPHQTTQSASREPAGLAGDTDQHTALRLAERGYVTLTYDAICFGERHDPASGHYGDAIPFYRTSPAWSLLGKMIWDLSRGVDYLQTLDIVDHARIGSIGHSHGGITTLYGMAFDERLAVGVVNCGYDTFRIDGNTFRWSHATALLPRLGFYVRSPYIDMDHYRGVPDSEVIQVPFDHHMLLALIAPRPLLLTVSDDDFVFPNAGWSARRTMAQAAPLYAALGAQGHVDAHYFHGGHRFPSDVAARAYDWLDRSLQLRDAGRAG